MHYGKPCQIIPMGVSRPDPDLGVRLSDRGVFHQCMYGTPYKKPTTLWCFGGFPGHTLGKSCHAGPSGNTCGRAVHQTLEFGGMPTAPAAAYPTAFCASYAAIIHKMDKATSARERVKIITKGKVRKHIDRGETRV